MFSKKQRLNTSLFDEVFNFGKTKRAEDFLVKYKNNVLGFPRFAISVSKKKVPSAVKRHFLKRKFFKALAESKLNKINKDFVFILGKIFLDKKEEEIVLIINRLDLE